MSSQTWSADLHTSHAQVWVRLAAELREQAIRLMAQLAFKLAITRFDWPEKEYTHGPCSRQTQDST